MGGKYSFVYLPVDLKREPGRDGRQPNLGYAFVSMVSPVDASHMHETQETRNWKWTVASTKQCEVNWAREQGYEAFVERFRDSAIMHESVDPDYKPTVYVNGSRAAFPPPLKARVRPPRGYQQDATGHAEACHIGAGHAGAGHADAGPIG